MSSFFKRKNIKKKISYQEPPMVSSRVKRGFEPILKLETEHNDENYLD